MAATCRDVVTRALRKLGALAAGENPAAEDAADAMDVLRGLILGWVAQGLFGRLSDVSTAVNVTAGEGQRITTSGGAVVTLPTVVPVEDDDLTERPVRQNAIVVVVNAAGPQTHMRNAYTGAWQQLDALDLNSPFPMIEAHVDGVAAAVAVAVADQFDVQPSPSTVVAAARVQSVLAHRFDSARTEVGFD